jgi:hypothetical protein
MRYYAAPLVTMQIKQFPEPLKVAHRVLVYTHTVAVRRIRTNKLY